MLEDLLLAPDTLPERAVQPAAAAGPAAHRPAVQPGPLRADRTVAAFSALLADTVDLDTIRGSLADAVQQALQPAHLTIWLSQPPQQIRG